eukprot:6812670-Alexandrium_andersonii.AAC.1
MLRRANVHGASPPSPRQRDPRCEIPLPASPATRGQSARSCTAQPTRDCWLTGGIYLRTQAH